MPLIEAVATPRDMEAAFAIRREVFCGEQGVAEEAEIDGLDDACRHYLVRLDGHAIGTARVRGIDGGDEKIERVAILAARRGAGYGVALMVRIMDDLQAAGARRIVLNAQCRVEAFYARLGFVAEGAVFEEAGIPHVRMVYVARVSEK